MFILHPSSFNYTLILHPYIHPLSISIWLLCPRVQMTNYEYLSKLMINPKDACTDNCSIYHTIMESLHLTRSILEINRIHIYFDWLVPKCMPQLLVFSQLNKNKAKETHVTCPPSRPILTNKCWNELSQS